MYPLILETINNSKISIGPSYYNATFSHYDTLVLAMAAAPFFRWKNEKNLAKNLIIHLF